ncbi:hypothetical protein CYMTET_21747 [Cymbomonas tetramitiformis]|uniref:Uncharacterized protein n=1 Tax=Cymbomonas tetramitiformis TaxID=36881 RepID=A0AAE0G197_9CHLO|nr:hypothetical protein CYMTET_21747 [Cymbomonas tetramitiformis]
MSKGTKEKEDLLVAKSQTPEEDGLAYVKSCRRRESALNAGKKAAGPAGVGKGAEAQARSDDGDDEAEYDSNFNEREEYAVDERVGPAGEVLVTSNHSEESSAPELQARAAIALGNTQKMQGFPVKTPEEFDKDAQIAAMLLAQRAIDLPKDIDNLLALEEIEGKEPTAEPVRHPTEVNEHQFEDTPSTVAQEMGVKPWDDRVDVSGCEYRWKNQRLLYKDKNDIARLCHIVKKHDLGEAPSLQHVPVEFARCAEHKWVREDQLKWPDWLGIDQKLYQDEDDGKWTFVGSYITHIPPTKRDVIYPKHIGPMVDSSRLRSLQPKVATAICSAKVATAIGSAKVATAIGSAQVATAIGSAQVATASALSSYGRGGRNF